MLLPRNFVLLVSSYQQIKRGITILAYMTNPKQVEEVGLLSHNLAREGYVWYLSSSLKTLLIFPVKRNTQQPKSDKGYQGFHSRRNS